jgi:hypothetical protein
MAAELDGLSERSADSVLDPLTETLLGSVSGARDDAETSVGEATSLVGTLLLSVSRVRDDASQDGTAEAEHHDLGMGGRSKKAQLL